MRTAWTLYDPIEDVTYAFPVNPYQDNGSNAVADRTSFQVKAGAYQDGLGGDHISNIVMDAGTEMERFDYTGRTYTQQELDALEVWARKNYPVELTDDLGRHWMVMIEAVQPQRVRNGKNQWKHEYTFRGFILWEVEDATP